MSLISPNLDDRSFSQLMEECAIRIRKSCPQWNDLGPNDPGLMMVELFAHLTETMLFRFNRIPDKAYVEFLRLLGVKLLPPSAATVTLEFSRANGSTGPIAIPKGTRVTTARPPGGGEAPAYTTLANARIEAGESSTCVRACNAEAMNAELAGISTGLPAQQFTARKAPIIAQGPEGTELIVAIETLPTELDDRAPAIILAGKTFRIWQEVDDFCDTAGERHVYVADRSQGTITFAPALQAKDENGALSRHPLALAEIPPASREVRLWYMHGGGVTGDVGPGTLTVLPQPIPGVTVTNPAVSLGGSAQESLENALSRGPLELRTPQRAVTARDFESIAIRHGGTVARAKAFTRASLWKFAAPGTVELLLVPTFPGLQAAGHKASAAEMTMRGTAEVCARIEEIIDERSPLGTSCKVSWVRYKTVSVHATIACHREQKAEEVRERVLRRLHQAINPLPAGGNAGWGFGQSLRAFHVYDLILGEPGVKFVEKVRLCLDEVPEKDVKCIKADASQPGIWYATSGEKLFRSVDDAAGWEVLLCCPGEEVRLVQSHARLPGRIAVTSRNATTKTDTKLWISGDCGETWGTSAQLGESIEDLAWIVRGTEPALLLATEGGLYELSMKEGSVPVQIVVDAKKQNRALYAVAVSTDIRGVSNVAVASRGGEGVWISTENGLPHTFSEIGLTGEDVRTLVVQEDGPRRFLWAGTRCAGFEEGKGCHRWDLTNPDGGWMNYADNWSGGSCLDLAFAGRFVFAGTHHAGVLRLDTGAATGAAIWENASVNCGLPLKEVDRFHPIESLDVPPGREHLLAATAVGILHSEDSGKSFQSCSNKEFVDSVSLPSTWLFCSGEHTITLMAPNETR